MQILQAVALLRQGADPLTVSQLLLQHSADTDSNWKLNLRKITRAIELYNDRSSTSRTGRYHVQAGTEDGFAPGT